MDKENQLNDYLRCFPPAELYNLRPGQIVYFVPSYDIDQRTSIILSRIFQYMRRIDKDNNVIITLVPTENKHLIGTLAGRMSQDTDSPYNVIIGTTNTIAGFAGKYFGVDVNDIMDRMPKAIYPTSTTEPPIMVPVSPENGSDEVNDAGGSYFDSEDDGFDMGMLISKPEPGSSKEQELKEKYEKQYEWMLRECAFLGIDIDADKIKTKVEDGLKAETIYELIIQNQFHRSEYGYTKIDKYDIFVADGDEYKLELTAIEKAVYLTFLLYKDGISISDTCGNAREIIKRIYEKLPSNDNKCVKTCWRN